MHGPIAILAEDWNSPDGERLRVAQRVELDARYGCDDHEPGITPSAADVAVFLVARGADGTALGCGGLRLLGDGLAEIKYVDPASRGTGVATAVLRAIKAEARSRGVGELVLETGDAQPDAMRFYEREGYRRIENFGPYVGSAISVCFARALR